MTLLVKNLPASAGDLRDIGFIHESGGSPGGGHGILLPGESHGQRSLAGYRSLGRKESDTTEAI